MPLQTSGAISLGQIGAEYIDAAPHSMSEFRGRNGFPATGAISFNQAYGNYGKLYTYLTTANVYTPADKFAASNTYGYINGSQGNLNPKTFVHDSNTITIESIYRINGGLSNNTPVISMSGFTSTQTIGSVWSTLTKGSYVWTAANADTFSYSNGTCSWSFYNSHSPGGWHQHNLSGYMTFKMT
jgi:hypothetical protein